MTDNDNSDDAFKAGFRAGVREAMVRIQASLVDAGKQAKDPKLKAMAHMLNSRLVSHRALIEEDMLKLSSWYLEKEKKPSHP